MSTPVPLLPPLRTIEGVWRLFLSAFLLTMAVGYAAGLYFVDFTTGATPTGTVEQFRGNEEVPLEEAAEIKFAKSTKEMLNVIHAHVTSFALIYLAVGGLFLLSSYPPGVKAVLAVEPFAATLLLFGGMAGLRYSGGVAPPAFAWLMMLAGLSTALCLYVMVGLSLWELWRPRSVR